MFYKLSGVNKFLKKIKSKDIINNEIKLPIQKHEDCAFHSQNLFLEFQSILWLSFLSLSHLASKKQWKKPHHNHVIGSSEVCTKDKRGTRGAHCSLATSFGPSSATLALLKNWSMGQETKNFNCNSVWFVPILSWISTVVMRAPYQVFLGVCFKILLSWTAHSFFARWTFYHFTGPTLCTSRQGPK